MAAASAAPLALVMGDVDMVRALGIAGIQSAFFGFADDSARFSRHVRASLPWIDQWERQQELVRALLELARSQPRRAGPLPADRTPRCCSPRATASGSPGACG